MLGLSEAPSGVIPYLVQFVALFISKDNGQINIDGPPQPLFCVM